jgi:two-component system, chemotaxis family, chemotaxis protein CheY
MNKIALVSIIDDDKFFQFATKRLLEASGQVDNILQFDDGEEAIKYFLANKDNEENLPDLVFLDLNMPYLDGWQFLDEFTANNFTKEITIYICTSSDSVYDKERFESYPKLAGYLIKPIAKNDVFKVIERTLS